MTAELELLKAPEMTLEEMVDRCGKLSAEKSAIEKEMQVYRKRIVDLAKFPENSKSTRIIGRHYVAKVEKKEDIKYDKELLNRAMAEIGKEKFKELFDWDYVPKAKKAEIDAFIKHSQFGGLIANARMIKELSTSVSFVANEEV